MDEYFKQVGLEVFTPQELDQISQNYASELKLGIEGKLSSLKMLDTLLSPVDLKTLKVGAEALVLEVGGSHIYGARVVIDSDHNPKIIPGSYTKVEMSKRQFDSFQQFIDEVIEGISSLIAQSSPPQAFGLIWSFPAKPVRVDYGIDNTGTILTKELVIPGIEDAFIGQILLEELSKKNSELKNLKMAVLNDTPAVALSIGSFVGAVVGTGFNLAVASQNRLYNSESGNFNKLPVTALSQKIDNESLKPGAQLAEKQISGYYMGEQLRQVVEKMAEIGLIKARIDGPINSSTVTRLLEEPSLNPELAEAAKRIRTRSAQLVGVMIGTAILAFADQFANLELVEVPVGGSVFWNMPGYSDITEDVANKFAGKKVVCRKIEHSGILGAAIASLSLVKQPV